MSSVIAIPEEYFFKMAKQDYFNWKKALPREFFQNSIDAGAKNIYVNFYIGNEDSDHCIVVRDDGCGMTEDVILDKLLVLGGSHKENGSVGAFGKAKELLYFSWKSYQIKTLDNIVEGRASTFDINKSSEYVKGTVSKIWIDLFSDIDSIKNSFEVVAKKNYVNTNIFIDGKKIVPLNRRGKLRKEGSWYKIYQNKSQESSLADFRINGIWMFDRYIGADHGKISIEMNNDSIQYLTSNRDGLKGQHLSEIDSLIADLQTNKVSFFDDSLYDSTEVLTGCGEISLETGPAEQDPPVQPVQQNLRTSRETSFNENVDNFSNNKVKVEIELENPDVSFLSKPDSFFGYEPDFILNYKGKKSFKIKNFMKTKKAITLAVIWTEIVKQVLLDNNILINFTAGFIFNDKCMAANLKKNGRLTIAVNPFLIGSDLNEKHIMSNRKLLLESLKSLACHEIAHCIESSHNERFVNFEAQIRANTWKSEKIYRSISKINRS